ncbi:MAG: class I SAM-dependent methyltransferase [Endomicrobiia bacterium]
MNRKQFFDMQAEKWDSYIDDKLIKRIEEKILPLLNIRKNDTVLDVGCGTGILLPYLKKNVGQGGIVFALDFSKKMLNIAKKKYGNICKYVCADASATSFEDNSFDKIICFNVFPHFPNKSKVLKEFFRILKKNGVLIITHADSRKNINKHHMKISGVVKKDFMPDDKKIISLLKSAGYQNLCVYNKKTYYYLSAKKVF